LATFLLIIIYIAFIGLGIPDSIFGAAWPAIYGEFALPVSYASFVTLTTSFCTFLSSLVSGRIINRFGTYTVTAVSTVITVFSLFAISLSGNFGFIVLLAVPLGFGGGAIDSALNNYIALYYNAMQMNLLHCFYGVGVTISPYLLSFALGSGDSWRGGYKTVALLQMLIAVCVVLSLPLWRLHRKKTLEREPEEAPVTLKFREMLGIKRLPAVWTMFFASCAVEAVCGAWGSTFLVEQKGMAVELAARTVTLYYLGIALGRLLSGLLSIKLSCKRIMLFGEITLALAVAVLLLPLGYTAGIGLFLVGLGVSPIYPNLMHLTPKLFGRSVSQSIIGTQMAFASLGIMLSPVVFGFFAERFGVGLFPCFLAIVVLMLICGGIAVQKRKSDC